MLAVSSVLFLHPASLVTAFGHHLMPSNGLTELVIRALSDITYYDEILSRVHHDTTGLSQNILVFHAYER